MKMDRIKEIWSILNSDATSISGIRKIRYSEESKCDLFLCIKTPENERMLAIRASGIFRKKFRELKNIRALNIEILSDSQKEDQILLCLTLKVLQYQDIFDTLIQDIILHVLELSNEKEIVQNYCERIAKWQSFFERMKPDGLTTEQQHGLYGELVLIKRLLGHNSACEVIKSWVGGNHAIQDFQYNHWAVEVKTSCGKNHQKIQISNERQLDESLIEKLFLFHVSIDARQGTKDTLNEIISEIKAQLSDNELAFNLFCQKLLDSGYYEIHKDLYAETSYQIRDAKFYCVENDFPRLTERDIPGGIGDVSYSINIGDCDRFVCEESGVYKILCCNDGN